ncbi:hypothetical protein HN680_00645 [Candidatus Peregrinibacteria bacterium]|nr:hypothetical protein [Candidatus Peregrinibacteria bacterium]
MNQTNIKQFKNLVVTSLVLPKKIKLDLLKIADKLPPAALERFIEHLQNSKEVTLKNIKEIAKKDPQKLKPLLKGVKKIQKTKTQILSKIKRKSIKK